MAQLLEFVLALPFAVGFKTAAVARLLAATLAAEAATCWPFWADWPTQSYAAHVRWGRGLWGAKGRAAPYQVAAVKGGRWHAFPACLSCTPPPCLCCLAQLDGALFAARLT